MKKIYLLTQDTNRGYDTYDSCVVVANNAEEAVTIHPYYGLDDEWLYCGESRILNSGWCNPKHVSVTLIGVTDLYNESKVVCSSFNAG